MVYVLIRYVFTSKKILEFFILYCDIYVNKALPEKGCEIKRPHYKFQKMHYN